MTPTFKPGDRVRYKNSRMKGTVSMPGSIHTRVNWDNFEYCNVHNDNLIKLLPKKKAEPVKAAREWVLARHPVIGRWTVQDKRFKNPSDEPSPELVHVIEKLPGHVLVTREMLFDALKDWPFPFVEPAFKKFCAKLGLPSPEEKGGV